MTVDLAEYERLGDLDAPFQRTRKHERAQRELEQMHEYVQRQHADNPPRPPLSPDQIEGLRRILAAVHDRRINRPYELMRWRLRLYCGHVVERTAHYTHKTVHATSFTATAGCPECGLDPATIIDAAAIGLAGDRPTSHRTKPAPPSKPTRAQLEARVRELEAEVERLHKEES